MQAGEPALIKALLTEPAVEALDGTILHRLAGINEEEPHPVLMRPPVQVTTAQLGSVVDDEHVRVAAFAGDILKHADQPLAG